MNTLPDEVLKHDFYVIKDYDNKFVIWPKSRYERYIKQATDNGGGSAFKLVMGFNGDEDYLFPKEYAKAYAPVPSEEVKKRMDEAADKYAFRVPYDGTQNFYDEIAHKHFYRGMEEGYSLAAPVPGKEEVKIPSQNMFMAGGNTQSEKDFYQLGYSAAMQSFNSDAVEFAEWIQNKYYMATGRRKKEAKWKVAIAREPNDRLMFYTTQELYILFLADKNKIQQAHDKATHE